MYVTRKNGFPSFYFCVLLSESFYVASQLRQTQCLFTCFDDSSILKLGMVLILPTLRNSIQGLNESLHMTNGLETLA